MTDKIINLSHSRLPKNFTEYQKNFTESINLLKNEYHLEFIFSNIQNKLKKLFQLESHNIPIIPHTTDEHQKKIFLRSMYKT